MPLARKLLELNLFYRGWETNFPRNAEVDSLVKMFNMTNARNLDSNWSVVWWKLLETADTETMKLFVDGGLVPHKGDLINSPFHDNQIFGNAAVFEFYCDHPSLFDTVHPYETFPKEEFWNVSERQIKVCRLYANTPAKLSELRTRFGIQTHHAFSELIRPKMFGLEAQSHDLDLLKEYQQYDLLPKYTTDDDAVNENIREQLSIEICKYCSLDVVKWYWENYGVSINGTSLSSVILFNKNEGVFEFLLENDCVKITQEQFIYLVNSMFNIIYHNTRNRVTDPLDKLYAIIKKFGKTIGFSRADLLASNIHNKELLNVHKPYIMQLAADNFFTKSDAEKLKDRFDALDSDFADKLDLMIRLSHCQ